MTGKKTDLAKTDCAIARSLQIIGDWWSLLIIRDAFKGMTRFGEFQKSLGLAKNILSSRLQKLVNEGIFETEPDSRRANAHAYKLTEKGRALYVVIAALWQWGETACFEPGELQQSIVDSRKCEPLAPLVLKARDGRVLGPNDFRLSDSE